MIYNKSGHPIDIKKISIRLWTLRDEIEAAIERRMKECEAAGVPLYIDDIKKFYNLNKEEETPDNVVQLNAGASEEEGMNSLMESLGDEVKAEGEEETQEASSEENPEVQAAAETTEVAEGEAAAASPVLDNAEEIIAEQATQGLDTNPNPILMRPYERQAPDLDKISYGFTLLSDINMENMLGFVKDSFLQGQSIVVEFLIPQSFRITADVTYCHHYAMRSKIISSSKPDYRLQCKFTYLFAGERTNLRNFLKSIEPTVTNDKRKPKSEEDTLDI